MSAARLRVLLITLIVVSAVISLIGNRSGSAVLNGLGAGLLLTAVAVYAFWRRAVRDERAARVFDREAKTDEAGTRTDQ
jgi:hypothetical protein